MWEGEIGAHALAEWSRALVLTTGHTTLLGNVVPWGLFVDRWVGTGVGVGNGAIKRVRSCKRIGKRNQRRFASTIRLVGDVCAGLKCT
jgi:hypothetical protein